MAVLRTLYPMGQSYPDRTDIRSATRGDYSTTLVEPPTLFGGGSVADDSDTSYVEIAAFPTGSDSSAGMELLACTFSAPSSWNPYAFVYQMRAKTPAESYLSAYDVPGAVYPDLVFTTTRRDSTGELLIDKSPSFSHPSFYDLLERHLGSPTWISWFDNSIVPSLTGPDAGWFTTTAYGPDAIGALTAGDLRLELAVLGPRFTAKTALLDVLEVRLLVACQSVGAYPLRRWPGGAATGPTRVWPRRITRRPGTY